MSHHPHVTWGCLAGVKFRIVTVKSVNKLCVLKSAHKSLNCTLGGICAIDKTIKYENCHKPVEIANCVNCSGATCTRLAILHFNVPCHY